MSDTYTVYIDSVCYEWNGKAYMRRDHTSKDRLWLKYYYDENGRKSTGNVIVAPEFPLDQIPEAGSYRLLIPDDLKR